MARKAPRVLIDERRIAHIFRQAEGHLPHDTPESRQLLLSVANEPGDVVGTDRYGNVWSARVLPDGRQAWVQVRGNRITNGSINARPRFFIFGYGL